MKYLNNSQKKKFVQEKYKCTKIIIIKNYNNNYNKNYNNKK